MNYSKPEVIILGEANTAIRGDKPIFGEPTNVDPAPLSFELED